MNNLFVPQSIQGTFTRPDGFTGSSVSWGIASEGNVESEVTFDPSPFPIGQSIRPNEIFPLGGIFYRNGSTQNGTGIDSLDLNVNLLLKLGGKDFFVATQADVSIVNTPNVFKDGDPRNADSLVINESNPNLFNDSLRTSSVQFAEQNAVLENKTSNAIIWAYISPFLLDPVRPASYRLSVVGFGEVTEGDGFTIQEDGTVFSSTVNDVPVGSNIQLSEDFPIVVDGTNQGDFLTGSIAPDDINGFNGKDTLIGLDSNDTLEGGNGKDILIGADPNSENPGISFIFGGTTIRAEKDILTGGNDSDTFVLGDENNVYYDDARGDFNVVGDEAYALVTDFINSKDFLQLNGSIDDYTFSEFSIDGKSGTGVFLNKEGEQELIGLVEGNKTIHTRTIRFLDDESEDMGFDVERISSEEITIDIDIRASFSANTDEFTGGVLTDDDLQFENFEIESTIITEEFSKDISQSTFLDTPIFREILEEEIDFPSLPGISPEELDDRFQDFLDSVSFGDGAGINDDNNSDPENPSPNIDIIPIIEFEFEFM